MPRKLSAPSEPTLRMDDHFCQGDFTFLSSDKCIFRVFLKDVLSKGTSSLRHAVKTCSNIPQTTNCMDLDEPANILRAFLNIYFYARPPAPSSFPIDNFYALVLFATKLKEADVINQLRPILPKYLPYKKADPYPIFQCAVLFEDWYTAGDAIGKHSKDYSWHRDTTVKTPRDLALGCKLRLFDLDPSGMPYHYWMEMPKKVCWALVRACADKQGWKERGERFTELMVYIDERDVEFPKWAAMEAGSIVEASSDSSSAADRGMEIDQAPPPPPSKVKVKVKASRPTATKSRTIAAGLCSPEPKSSARVRLRTQEPLFLPHSSCSPEPPSENDRQRVDRVVSDGDSLDVDSSLLDWP